MPSFLSPIVDDATFTSSPEVDSAREVAVSLSLDGQPVGEGVIVPAYLSDNADGLGQSALGNIGNDRGFPIVYDSHYQTDANGQFTLRVAVESDESATLYLAVVMSDGSLAVSGPLVFTV